ncbi:cytochrome P450 [Hysterangium stoloniferum]|nr:cytochrome P450 [Hysterangium stoloniferum]
MLPVYVAAITLFGALTVFHTLFRRIRSNSIVHLRGPKPDSWLVGNLPALLRPREAGDGDFPWTKEFGNTMAIKGVMGKDILMTADPKAWYNFPKTQAGRMNLTLTTGYGLFWAEGHNSHARQRKIMNPAFSFGPLRIFLPLFMHTSRRMVARLKAALSKSNGASSVCNIMPWLKLTTLEVIGTAGFDYQLHTTEQGPADKLARAYDNLLVDVFLERPDSVIIREDVMDWVPQWIAALLLRLPNKSLKRLHDYMEVSLVVAKELVDRQKAIHAAGKDGSKDIMSILVTANLAENPEDRLNEIEVLSQLTTLFLAGHDSTANALTWEVYELARNPEYQTLVRDEIKARRIQAIQRGDDELSDADLDSMKYLLSLIRPIVPGMERESKRDDVIPLSTPITTKKGEVIQKFQFLQGRELEYPLSHITGLSPVINVGLSSVCQGSSPFGGTNLGVIANLFVLSLLVWNTPYPIHTIAPVLAVA